MTQLLRRINSNALTCLWDVLVIVFCCCEIDTMTKATVIKESIYMRQIYNFRNLVHCHHAEEHGSTVADRKMENQLRILHPDVQAARGRETLDMAWAFQTAKPNQSDNQTPNKAVSPNPSQVVPLSED